MFSYWITFSHLKQYIKNILNTQENNEIENQEKAIILIKIVDSNNV